MSSSRESKIISYGRREVKVTSCGAWIEKKETKILETEPTLNYITPHFRAYAEVSIPELESYEGITVGWIQAVTDMKFVNTYPEGKSSWEIPQLNTKIICAVSDADGRQYPWYGVTTECKTFRGPTFSKSKAEVLMNDNFSPRVSWAIPVGKEQPDTLCKVERDQTFIAWLVYKIEPMKDIYILKSYEWRAQVNIEVDCNKPLKERSTLLEPIFQDDPMEVENRPIPISALAPPRANEAQNFVWRPRSGDIINLDWRPVSLYCLIPSNSDVKLYRYKERENQKRMLETSQMIQIP